MNGKRPNIVCLDGYTLNPGDNPWSETEAMGNFKSYDRTPNDQIMARAKDADIILTNKTPLTKETIDQLPNLKFITVLATGYNVVDYKHARTKGIPVTNVPEYGTNSVAQFVFALLLELCHQVGYHSDAVHQGRWSSQPDFSFWDSPLIELYGRTLGVVGCGKIGRRVAEIGGAFGMKVLGYDVYKGSVPGCQDFQWAELDDLLKKSDVVSLNCPLFPENTGMINKNSLKLMKKSAFLINASRGGLVVDQELADALNAGVIAGAALDVVGFTEPPAKDNPLLKAKNCIVTPHIAWAALEGRKRLMHTVAENVKGFLDGKPVNVVN
jgi:glycerate dehydrogenase